MRDYIGENYANLLDEFTHWCRRNNPRLLDEADEMFHQSVHNVLDVCHRHRKVFETEGKAKGYFWITLRNMTRSFGGSDLTNRSAKCVSRSVTVMDNVDIHDTDVDSLQHCDDAEEQVEQAKRDDEAAVIWHFYESHLTHHQLIAVRLFAEAKTTFKAELDTSGLITVKHDERYWRRQLHNARRVCKSLSIKN